MTDQNDKTSATEALKRALASKKAGGAGGQPGNQNIGKAPEKAMQRQAAAMNKPAFRKASKRG